MDIRQLAPGLTTYFWKVLLSPAWLSWAVINTSREYVMIRL